MNRTRLLALLPIFAILLVSCSEAPDGTSGRAPALTEPQQGFVPASELDLDRLEYETLSGTLMPGMDGALSADLTTWPDDCRFSLFVPASSSPGGGPINFTMSIPTQASYLQYRKELDQRLIIRLAPDGEQFSGPITIQGTWMPWQAPPADTLWYSSGSDSGMAVVTYLEDIDRYRVTFDVDHFSDWEVGPDERR